MDAESLQIVAQRCQASRRLNERIRSLLPVENAPSLRANFSRCAIDLTLEHHSGLVRVVEAGEYGAGGALLRPILEASTAAVWFIYVATCATIQALPTSGSDNDPVDIPMLKPMIRALIPTFPGIQGMYALLDKGGAGKWLHKYTHGGMPQLARRTGDRWSERDVILTLLRADLFVLPAAISETLIAENPELASYAFGARDEVAAELQARFKTPPTPPQPHSWPHAPLLADGCGPPFA